MFIELMLATALDLSLPEFQPEIDISGNVIVSELDDISGEFEAVEIPLEEIPIEEIPIEENQIMLKSLETHTVTASVKNGYRISSGAIAVHSGDNLYYVYLTANIEYTISTSSGLYTASALTKGTAVHSHSGNTITPTENIYLVKENSSFSVTYTTGEPDEPPVEPDDPSGNNPDDPSGNNPDDPSGNNPDGTDYTALINAVNDVYKTENAIALILMFMAFCPFLTKVVDKLMFRKED